MRGLSTRFRTRFAGVQVRSDLALTVGLLLAGVMIVVAAVAAAVALASLLT
jgi:hypothetical protein